MAYSTNPNLPKARAIAMQLLVREQLPLQVVANRCGVHRSTIWRWKRKWDKLNEHVQLTNDNRPSRSQAIPSSSFRLAACTWRIPTAVSRPHTSPTAVSQELVGLVLAVRARLKRCAEVVWHHLTAALGISVSLSSVRRILWRSGVARGRKNRVRRDNPRRPQVTRPGELVQTDTIHHVDPRSGKRLYYYTVIDLFTRMTYVTLAPKLRQGLATQAVLGAQSAWGFPIAMVQADNGPEYGRYFEQQMKQANIQTRHSRLHRPNDNAHIERFNRTIQTECIGYYWNRSVPLQPQQGTLTAYLEYYNTRRVHLGIQLRTPISMLQRS
ncbi:MAG: DDE-type integrase/transposase/recombinase [Candidatus Saccharimonadales bacterium]